MSPSRWSLRARINGEDHRVTPKELLFDVVYVFAFIQVTDWIAKEFTWRATAEGLTVLAILWWVWISWAWLGNVMRADKGLPLAGFIVSMVAVFGLTITIPDLWEAEGGGLAPLAFTGFYVLIRVIHAAVFFWGARDDARIRRQILLSTAAWIPAAGLLMAGALAEPQERLYWWIGTVALDIVATWVLSVKGPGWKVHSGEHFAERFDLVVILAIGESVLAVGITAAGIDLNPELMAIALLGVLIAIALWWPYFKDVGPTLENALKEADAEHRNDLARDAYTYLHLPLIMGILLVSAGNKGAVTAIELEQPSGDSALLMAGGAALVALTCALLMRLAGGTSRWLVASAVFFALAMLWMPQIDPTIATLVTIVVLSTVGWLTPATRNRKSVTIASNEEN
ncbi:low temperature requirement protein A [Demequina muriae]|uniref:Low temperature requirement protein A n=1 Tax=Demequina muriae TaxID=3051664 RepID=A0ABT8GG02_9MICO|nr:low temperature requirement protein A [Demequina sp. EGI L300058]MDN4480294.1 low temperature requirement protein A [Demequina sp. EGI L300058]